MNKGIFDIDWLNMKLDKELCIVYCYKIYGDNKDWYYIGQTTLSKRYKIYERHRIHLKGKQMIDKFLRTHKYRYSVLWIGYRADTDAMERYFIKELHTLYPLGLNLEIGGNNAPMNELSRKKSSELKKKMFKDGILSPYWRDHPMSDEHKRHISENHWMLGKKCEGEYWQKLYDSCPNKKPIYQIDPKTNEIVKEWASIKEARRTLGFASTGGLRDCLHGRQKTSHGYKWKFVNEDDI